MGLETGTHVNDMNTANPTSADPKSQGDDHLRLIKNVLLNSFAGFPGMVIVTGSEAPGATESDYTITVSPAPAAYTASMLVVFKATHANTSASTVQVNALGTKPLLAVDGSALKAGDIESGGLVAAFYDGTSFYLVSGNDRADRNGDTYSGTHDFTGAVLRAATKAFGSAGNEVATVDYVNNAAFQAALPAQTGKNGQVISSDGTSASWTSGGTAGQFLQRSAGGAPVWATAIPPNIQRSARTSNTMLVLADNQRLIDITSGTFAQTFGASANLGNGWFCYLRNSGSGDVTLDPNGSETIDGLTSYIMYPGEVRLVQCDGFVLRSIVINPFCKEFTASTNFIKPPGYSAFSGLVGAAGGGGSGGVSANGFNSAAGAGGGGGAILPFKVLASDVSTTNSVVVGAGGTGGAAGNPSIAGGSGGSSTFLWFTANGGIGGSRAIDQYSGVGGAGGSWQTSPPIGGYNTNNSSTAGVVSFYAGGPGAGGGGANSPDKYSFYGSGGGGGGGINQGQTAGGFGVGPRGAMGGAGGLILQPGVNATVRMSGGGGGGGSGSASPAGRGGDGLLGGGGGGGGGGLYIGGRGGDGGSGFVIVKGDI